MHLGTSHVYELNETGWLVWDGLERGSSLAEIAGLLADRYEPEGASIAADITQLVDELRRLGLVA